MVGKTFSGFIPKKTQSQGTSRVESQSAQPQKKVGFRMFQKALVSTKDYAKVPKSSQKVQISQHRAQKPPEQQPAHREISMDELLSGPPTQTNKKPLHTHDQPMVYANQGEKPKNVETPRSGLDAICRQYNSYQSEEFCCSVASWMRQNNFSFPINEIEKGGLKEALNQLKESYNQDTVKKHLKMKQEALDQIKTFCATAKDMKWKGIFYEEVRGLAYDFVGGKQYSWER